MTEKELQALLQEQTKDVITGLASKVKSFVDCKVTVAKNELKDQITKELSGVEGLADNLEKLQKLADAFVKVFDENSDGTISADEIIAKISAIQANIDKVASDLANYKGEVKSLFDGVNKAIGELKDRVGALELAVAKNSDEIASIKADLSTKYYTEEQIKVALTINKEEILKEVDGILECVVADSNSDGAVE